MSLEAEVTKTNNLTFSLAFSYIQNDCFVEFGAVYVAKKNGGSDDGKMYALKAQKISHAIKMTKIYDNCLIGERKVSAIVNLIMILL